MSHSFNPGSEIRDSESIVRVTVDDRERRSPVPDLLARAPGVSVRWTRLEAGDYALGNGIVVERKTARGFLLSLTGGHLFAQTKALKHAAERAVMILEGGSLYETGIRIDPAAIRGALVSLAAVWYLPVLRAGGPAETVALLLALARQMRRGALRGPWCRPGFRARRPDLRKSFILQGLPRVGPALAARLLERFGSVRAVVGATEDELREVRGIGAGRAQAIRDSLS
jgi:Fanconi anemia group M protein